MPLPAPWDPSGPIRRTWPSILPPPFELINNEYSLLEVADRPASLEDFMDQLRTFTERKDVAAKLERYTGIGADTWQRAKLRLTDGEFFQQLNLKTPTTTGRLDARFTAINQDPMTQNPERDDPFSEAGHMMYVEEAARVKFKRLVDGFIREHSGNTARR